MTQGGGDSNGLEPDAHRYAPSGPIAEYADRETGTIDSGSPVVVPVPRNSPMAFAGPAIGIVGFIAVLISPAAFGVVMAIAAVLVAIDISRLLEARAVAVPRLAVAVLAGVIPVAALRDIGAVVVALSGAMIVIFVWGMTKIHQPGLGDSLAGSATVIALAGFGFAHGSLIATGEFRGGPSSAISLVIITLLLIAANQIASTVFAAATVQVGGARKSSGNLWGALATLFIAIVASTIRNPPVNRVNFLVLGIGVAGACAAARAITSTLLSSPSDPEEIIDYEMARNAFALQGLGVAAFALPAAYYIARWLFV